MNADAERTVYDIGGSGEGGSRGFSATVSIYDNMLLRDQRTRISWLVRFTWQTTEDHTGPTLSFSIN